MKKIYFLFLSLAIICLAFCRLNDNTKASGENRLALPMSDSAMIRAAANYKNYCAGCHWEDLSWFEKRPWKYGFSVEDISKSTRIGMPDFGMPSFAETFSAEELQELSEYIYITLNLEAKERKDFIAGEGIYETEKLRLRPDTIIKDLKVPWGMAFLPNGDIIVNEREGRMLRYSVDGELLSEIRGLPEIHSRGQGGLMDIRLHPDYESNGWLYFAYSYQVEKDGEGWNTALMRAKLKGNELTEKQLLYEGIPGSTKGVHFGCKITFDGKGHVFFGIGDRGFMERAQDLSNDCGKIIRLKEDGSIPLDNPFVKNPQARPAIWSYGHRNPQGLVINPWDGTLWESEHGPKGGDELNLILAGKNYGWPEITFGIDYNGTIISSDTAKEGMEQPVIYWVPSIAPCGMTFVKSDKYPGWEGDLLVGSLRFNNMERLEISGNRVTHKEVLLNDIGRMRNIEVDSEGYVYIALENPGMIIKLVTEK
jgi:aldose sugar dehydrogenase